MNVVRINYSSSGGGIPLGFILIAAAFVVLAIGASVLTANYASRKGFPFWPILIASLFISFPVVLLIVALMPPREPPAGAPPAQQFY